MALVESLSGIRGIYGKDLTEYIAVKYAYSYLTFVKKKSSKKNPTIVIGADTRLSGVKICDTIMGILDCNFIVVQKYPERKSGFIWKGFCNQFLVILFFGNCFQWHRVD